MQNAPSSNVLARLDRLERENRRYKLAAVAAGLACFSWVACAMTQQKNTLAGERIVLLGADGSEKATLEVDSKGNPMLTLRNGPTSAILTTNGPSLLLRGADKKTGAFLGIDSNLTSRLELCSERLLDGVRLSSHADGSAGVYVLDITGRQRGSLESFGAGGSGLSFRDGQGLIRSSFGLDPSSLPNLLFMDDQGVRRLGMLIQEDGHPLVQLTDPKGRGRIEASTLFDGSPILEMKREDGTSVYRAP